MENQIKLMKIIVVIGAVAIITTIIYLVLRQLLYLKRRKIYNASSHPLADDH